MSSLATKLSNAADTTSSEVQSLIMEMRKALVTMKSIAVDYEKDRKSDKVQQVEQEALELVASYEDLASFAEAVKAVPQTYQPSEQPTDFKSLIQAEVNKAKVASPASGQNHPLFRQFREAVWNVHHSGQPMPGDEQEDIVMTSTQSNVLNLQCPITLKPVIELTNPVRCVDCRHIYDKGPIMNYIRTQKPPRCPVAGCLRFLQVSKVVCDSYLLTEIEELRSSWPSAPNARNIEDITDLIDDDNE